MSDDPVTELAPSRAVSAWWSGLGGIATAAAGWVLLDSAGHALAWGLLVATVVVSVPFFAQLLTPSSFTWRLDDRELVVRSPVRLLVVPWSEVYLARVVRQAGEPALELEVHGEEGPTAHMALLPLGADVDALHRALHRHLGVRADDPGPPAGEERTSGQ